LPDTYVHLIRFYYFYRVIAFWKIQIAISFLYPLINGAVTYFQDTANGSESQALQIHFKRQTSCS
jgi:hypothetical protein